MLGLLQLLRRFAHALTITFGLPGRANPEDQLKGPLAALLVDLSDLAGASVETQTEAQVGGLGGRPDMAVFVGRLLSGHIELKAPGLGADPSRLRGAQNKAQWEKFKALPNLLYTDGVSWALYRHGERVGSVVTCAGDPTQDGDEAYEPTDAERLSPILIDFLRWTPIVPHTSQALAAYLAPLARLLRDDVIEAVQEERSAVALLRDQWTRIFFADSDVKQFADAYAQTVVYALLLARLSGATSLAPEVAADALDTGNGLLAQTIRILGDREALHELRLGFGLVQRSLEALNPELFLERSPDPWLYFYEHFLDAYDHDLRRDAGVYYTPVPVVSLQVRLATELLGARFGKSLGFADDGVTFLDPATGTGAYLLAAVRCGLDAVRAQRGAGAVAARASLIARQMAGFEILVGPYAVAHLRLAQEFRAAGGHLPNGRLNVYLADTLENPFRTTSALALSERRLVEEHEAARHIKSTGTVLVVLGNPPYDRQAIEYDDGETRRKGGWVRFGDLDAQEERDRRPILQDFIEPARQAGQGVHLKNLYNDYVYFWRWALWRVFEHQADGGLVTFITASSYLAGPGFVGMRETMRREFDELWIIDLGGDNLGTRKSPNVFAIQTPVAIAIGIRGNQLRPDRPAIVHYARVDAPTRAAKLEALEQIQSMRGLAWADCPTAWQAPFLPAGQGNYFAWPLLTDLFPWQHSGAQFKRTWPIAISAAVLERRWRALVTAETIEDKGKLFRVTRDRSLITRAAEGMPGFGEPTLAELPADAPVPSIIRYCYRSFDRRYALFDGRLGDFLRPELFGTLSATQFFLCGLLTKTSASGPSLVATALVPDMDVFCGRGAKDIIPVYRDSHHHVFNLTRGLTEVISTSFATTVTGEDLVAYVVAILGSQTYAQRFWSELSTPGPRVPITKSEVLFREIAALGRELICLQTFGDRMNDTDHQGPSPGIARCGVAVPDAAGSIPEDFRYDEATRELFVGDGRFDNVTPEVMSFEVSGLKVVDSWLGYRMREPRGRVTSELNEILPIAWDHRMTDELLELLWTLERIVALEPQLENALARVVASECFVASELPSPAEIERRPAGTETVTQGGLFED